MNSVAAKFVGFIPMKDRQVQEGQLVMVYVNLNKPGFFSIQDNKSKLVLGYATSVLLKDAFFKLSLSGQTRARKEKLRNMHAFAMGNIVDCGTECPDPLTKIGYYNPFTVDTLVNEQSREPIEKSNFFFLENKRVFY